MLMFHHLKVARAQNKGLVHVLHSHWVDGRIGIFVGRMDAGYLECAHVRCLNEGIGLTAPRAYKEWSMTSPHYEVPSHRSGLWLL